MALPKNILFPVDFSDRCSAAAPAVANMARQLSVPVTLLYVLDIGNPSLDLSPVQAEVETVRQYLKNKLDSFVASELRDARREMADGPAAACIVQRAAGLEAPLIMMPTHGHTRFRALLLGSVTAGVLHDAVCPVWTAAHAGDLAAHASAYRSVLCAVDLGPRTPAVLQAARDFSACFGAELHIVHSVPRVDPRFHSGPADRAHALLLDQARAAGIDVPLEIVEGAGLVSGITEAAAQHGSDLLVIGRGVIQGPLGRLRTIAHELIRRSPCPVLSV